MIETLAHPTDMISRPTSAVLKRATVLLVAASVVALAGCSTRRVSAPAPVEDRAGAVAGVAGAATQPATNAGRPGFYTVKQGDTLYRIALESGQAWRDVQAWNNLPNPNVLEVGQVIRVSPPEPVAPPVAAKPANPAVVVATPVTTGTVEGRPITTPAGQPPVTTPGASPASAATPAAPAPSPTKAPDIGPDEIEFVWPSKGEVVATFDEARNKGISVAGKLGDPVLAAADGRVVYAGAGLRGYGNLIILKHNNSYLTAYAHNQALLVKEDQTVRQGQKIAEMGSSDTDRVKLHFEIRRQGKPVDPLGYLPKR